jgi:putative transposase
MNSLYRAIGRSKQGVHQWLTRELKRREEQMQLLKVVRKIREDHPRLSCREIYYMVRPELMGRDQFERFCNSHGFKLEVKRNKYKTTDSKGVRQFENHLKEMKELTSVNQAWVSDITYYPLSNQVYYLTFILDLYSRKIVGYSSSKTLRTTDTTIPALRMAKSSRKLGNRPNLILHSDGGGQYYCKEFLKMTDGMKNSMGKASYDNPHAERINGIIKNDYLKCYNPINYKDLKKKLAKAVYLYNNEKPHGSLNRLSPETFEKMTGNGELHKIWTINKRPRVNKKNEVSIYIN